MWKWLCILPLLAVPAMADPCQITSPLPLPVVLSTNTASAYPIFIGSQAIQLDPNGRSDDQPVFVGFAAPGTSTSSTGWKIMELIYDTSGNISQVLWANGTANFDKTWTSRAGYSYS